MTRVRLFIIIILTTIIIPSVAVGQSINPTGTYLDDNGDSVTMAPGDSYSGSAPLAVHFAANPTDLDGYSAYYEWRFYSEKDTSTPLYTRYDENTDFTFTQAGSFRIYLIARFTRADGDTVEYTEDDLAPITVSISESELVMPNAFSPNGDGINDGKFHPYRENDDFRKTAAPFPVQASHAPAHGRPRHGSVLRRPLPE